MTCSSQILSYRVRPMAWLSWFRRVAGFRILVSGVSVARMGVWAHGRALHMPRTRFGPRAWCGGGFGILVGGGAGARMGVWAHGRALHMPRTRFGPRAWGGVGGGPCWIRTSYQSIMSRLL